MLVACLILNLQWLFVKTATAADFRLALSVDSNKIAGEHMLREAI